MRCERFGSERLPLTELRKNMFRMHSAITWTLVGSLMAAVACGDDGADGGDGVGGRNALGGQSSGTAGDSGGPGSDAGSGSGNRLGAGGDGVSGGGTAGGREAQTPAGSGSTPDAGGTLSADGTLSAGGTLSAAGFSGSVNENHSAGSGGDAIDLGASGSAGEAGSSSASLCGNGVVEPGEMCDGSIVEDATCSSLGYTAGSLACSADCRAFATGSCRRAVSIAGGRFHTCVLFDNGKVKCWGSGHVLGLGDSADRGLEMNSMGDALPYVSLPDKATKLWAGVGYSSCALLRNGDLVCWGDNSYGTLGLGDTNDRGDEPGEMGASLPRVDVGAGRHAVEVAIGAVHTCALLDNGVVKCWGDNEYGQLGTGKPERIGVAPNQMGDSLAPISLGAGRTAVAIDAGHFHTCALLDNATVKCWGYNGDGQLGLGHAHDVGREGGQMGDALPGVDLGSGKHVIGLAAGGRQNCALLEGGSVKCWGGSPSGELGQGNTLSLGTKASHMGDKLPTVPLGTGRTVLSVNGWGQDVATFCARLDDETLKCWGDNSFAQCGVGDRENRGDDAAELGDALAVVRVGTGRHVVNVVGGPMHSCALLDDASVRCWGENLYGVLGLANGVSGRRIGDAPGEMGDALEPLKL